MPQPLKHSATAAYANDLADAIRAFDWSLVDELADALIAAWDSGANVWICGNGGSAANAAHWANDFIYPIAKSAPKGIRITALTANPAVVTCLGNDIGYDLIFSRQLHTFSASGDILIVLSGSGNSPNILRALETGQELGLKSFAILGFDGGKAAALADVPLLFHVNDMQVAEDAQMVVCHALVKALTAERPAK